MFIQEVIIDGFKSYAQRTVVSGWDAQFNAITGLNGSGKSNILDAICFVLGISNLSQVRASSLQDLVYKGGQGGVSKATVSIVFNNADAKQSPIGYEHCETITVTRQVVIGGRNKYLINGHAVQASAVQNLFHSVQLNVNNPHFLIMQGRITKVLNMKPPEILGMIEEAAGTRMFESKKQAALKTIEKKQSKVDEINKILMEDITPTLEKLRQERGHYLRWAANNTECERLARFCVAYDFVAAQTQRDKCMALHVESTEQLAAAAARVIQLRAIIAAKEAELREMETARAATMSGDYARLSAEEDNLSKELVKANTALTTRTKALKDEEKSRSALARALAEAEATFANLQAQLAAQQAEAAGMSAVSTKMQDDVATVMAKLNAARAGMDTEDDAGGAGSTHADQLIASKGRVTSLTASIASSEMKVKHLRATVKDAEKAAKAAAADAASLQSGLTRATKLLEAKQTQLAALNFNASAEEAMRARREALTAEVEAVSGKLEADAAGVAARLEFRYDVKNMGAGWDPKRVNGVLASLFKLKAPEAATALEIAAGGKLYQVVVDNETTGQALLQRGRLTRRTTFVPLTQVRSRPLTPAQIAAAEAISKGAAVPALSLIEFDPALRPAMEYAFGSILVCKDAATAKAVTYHKSVQAMSVTYDGDVFDPAGTLEGGSKPDIGGEPFLLRIARVATARAALTHARKELAEVESALASLAKASAAYSSLAADMELATHEVELMRQRLASSQLAMAEAKVVEANAAIVAEEKAIADARQQLKDAQARVKELEAAAASVAKARETRVAALEQELTNLKKAAAASEAKAKKATHAADTTACELNSASKERDDAAEQLRIADLAIAKLASEVQALEATSSALKEKHHTARAALLEAQQALAATDKAVKACVKERDAAVRGIEDAEVESKKLDAKLKTLARDAAAADKTVADMLAKHAWIEADRQFFGRAHTDYDFNAQDPKEASARLRALEKQQAELERKINKKVIGMIEQAEREYADLVNKKRIIENDRDKINRVIAELDEKKNEALRTTWAKVNKDFGSIFSMLLPGVTAKLDPPEGGTVLDGLEVRVAFNGVWKETLTELSGGQRSLLALSLILSLLLFKPAPMYILDEVDAALDLSHTQNIGHMIRTHFSKSQFIVVSLKQGMFNNANVIFRTKFVEGIGSTVTRTVPAGSALLMEAPAAAGASAAATSVLTARRAGAAAAVDVAASKPTSRAAGAAAKRRTAKAAYDEDASEDFMDTDVPETAAVPTRRGASAAAARSRGIPTEDTGL